jgi:4-hydroxy-2-oxoheptanedioate aldolase
MCLKLAHGTLDGDEPIYMDALKKIRDAAKANNLPMMGFGISPSGLKMRIEMGWNAFIVHGDIDAICMSAVDSLKTYSDAAYSTNGHVTSQQEKNGEQGLKCMSSAVDEGHQMANVLTASDPVV